MALGRSWRWAYGWCCAVLHLHFPGEARECCIKHTLCIHANVPGLMGLLGIADRACPDYGADGRHPQARPDL